MRHFALFLTIIAWAWALLLILGICSLSIYANGFPDGMRRASMTILSPAGCIYIFTPSVLLSVLGNLVRKHLAAE